MEKKPTKHSDFIKHTSKQPAQSGEEGILNDKASRLSFSSFNVNPPTIKGNVQQPWRNSLNPHCEVITLESGRQIVKFWADKTFRNLFERIAYGDI